MKPATKEVFAYLQSIDGADVTSGDVAEALGLTKRQVDGIFTAAIQRKNLGIRVPAEIELEDKTHKAIKFLHLTPEGMALNLDEEDDE